MINFFAFIELLFIRKIELLVICDKAVLFNRCFELIFKLFKLYFGGSLIGFHKSFETLGVT